MSKSTILTELALCVLTLAGSASADGLVVVRPTPDVPDPIQLAVGYHNVDITIRDQVAQVHIDQVFRNLNRHEVEGEYIFPIPDGAAVSDFVLYVDGKPVHAQALEASEALRIYEDLVRESRDPALLEYAGREMFRARIYPFPPGGDRRVRLDYDHLIEREGGLYRFVYPLSTEKFSSRPLESAYVRIELDADRPIRNAYCPSHAVEIEYLDATHLRVSWEESGTKPDRDLVLYYSLAEEAMDIRLVPFRPDVGEDGYFMLLASMGQDGDARVMAKDVVFVIDHSGSMDGEKIDQARSALVYCLEHLNREDRFNVVSFASSVDAFAPGLREAGRRDIREAVLFVRSLQAGGGTNISGALERALESDFSRRRSAFVIFLTDGLPTEGERDVREILAAVRQRTGWSVAGRQLASLNPIPVPDPSREQARVRVFPFGVGYDVNAVFLDQLADENGARPSYVRPTEDLQTRIESFYAQVADPVLTDLALRVSGARVRGLQPARLPDLFRGSQLVLFGRYQGEGPIEVTLSGGDPEGEQTYTVAADLPEREERNTFVGRLWATRQVGTLLRQVRLHGEEPELVEEITRLGLRFGIATPYTSFLVDERPRGEMGDGYHALKGDAAPPPPGGGSGGGWSRVLNLISPAAGKSAAPSAPLSASSGQLAFEVSKEVEEMVAADREDKLAANTVVRTVGLRTFRLQEGVWTQLDCPENVRAQEITVGSREYFELLRAHPELGAVFALGADVIVEVDGEWYRTRPAP